MVGRYIVPRKHLHKTGKGKLVISMASLNPHGSGIMEILKVTDKSQNIVINMSQPATLVMYLVWNRRSYDS